MYHNQSEQYFASSKVFAGNQGNHQNLDPFFLPKKLLQIFMGIKKKKSKEKIQNLPTQKILVFQFPSISYIFSQRFKKFVLGLVG